MRESLVKKVDHDYLQTASNKIKAECQALMATYQSEMSVVRKQRDEKVDERLGKSEQGYERALDELYFLKEQLKQLQEERKKDVEETAEFIKQIISAGKSDWQKEIQRLGADAERIRRELAEKAQAQDLAEVHARMSQSLDTKVDLREVQQALNECQSDIRDQLLEFRQSVQAEQRQAEADLRKIVDKKANVSEMQDALMLKADARNTPSNAEM